MTIGSSTEQYGNNVLRTLGAGYAGLGGRLTNPRAFALAFMRHERLLGASDHDDVLSDALYGIAKAVASYDDRDGGVSLVTWCWWKMRHEVAHGRRHRARFTREDPAGDWAAVGEFHPTHVERGYKRVEDRLLLQRWADMAHLTDLQADLLAWLATYSGQRGGPAPGGHSILNPLRGRRSAVNSGLARLRRVAVTGKPFVRWGGNKYTGPIASQVTDDDVKAAVDG